MAAGLGQLGESGCDLGGFLLDQGQGVAALAEGLAFRVALLLLQFELMEQLLLLGLQVVVRLLELVVLLGFLVAVFFALLQVGVGAVSLGDDLTLGKEMGQLLQPLAETFLGGLVLGLILTDLLALLAEPLVLFDPLLPLVLVVLLVLELLLQLVVTLLGGLNLLLQSVVLLGNQGGLGQFLGLGLEGVLEMFHLQFVFVGPFFSLFR